MKVKPIKFQEDNLYRHPDFALPPSEDQAMVKREQNRTPSRPNQILRTRTEHLNESFSADFDDEADENLFDGVDGTEDRGEEFSFETVSAPDTAKSRAVEAGRPNGVSSARTSPIRNTGHPRQANPRMQAAQAGRGQPGPQQHYLNQAPGRPQQGVQNPRQPQTPNQQNQPRPAPRGQMPPPAGESSAASRPLGQQEQNAPHNQPLRPTPPQTQQPVNQPRPGPQAVATPTGNAAAATTNRPPVGFVTSRAAELLQQTDAAPSLNNLPAFNPHAESPIPKEQRTPGVDHARSIPIKREAVGVAPAPQPPQPQVPQAAPGPQAVTGRPAPPAAGGSFGRPNVVNPHLDTNRRIGAPSYAMSPTGNRGAYKPPTFANGNGPQNALKRERPALQDVSNVNPGSNGTGTVEAPDAKRQKVEAPGAENTATVSS